jgi:predicted membrane chloride channel (bestrophin family)
MLAYSQCRKIAFHPFPFAWAQMILVLLILYTLSQPLMLVAYITNIWRVPLKRLPIRCGFLREI